MCLICLLFYLNHNLQVFLSALREICYLDNFKSYVSSPTQAFASRLILDDDYFEITAESHCARRRCQQRAQVRAPPAAPLYR